MPRGGGSAAKYGARYEDRWCACCALRVLAEEVSAIYIEQPGPEYEGFEFSLEIKGVTEYHQAKRQRTGEGKWTLAALAEAGVLRAFFERLHEAGSRCVFVSANAAPELIELADRARSAETSEQFVTAFLDSAEWQANFENLKKAWEAPDEWCWQALRRIEVRTIDEQTLAERIAFEAQMRLRGPDKSASGGLIEVLRDSVNKRLRASDLWELLEKKVGLTPNPLVASDLGVVQLRAANDRFRRSREGGRIGGQLLPRVETAELREAVGSNRVVLLQGQAGMGKSEVLSEFLEGLEAEGMPHLAFRLDRIKASGTAAQLGEELGLEAPPPVALSAASAGDKSVLIVDQLDAISTTSGRNPEFLDAVEEMLRLALADPGMKVVLACRSFDARHDARIRQLFAADEEEVGVTVGRLPDEDVRSALIRLGVDPKALSGELIDLCSVPLHLSLMSQITARSAGDVRRLKTLNDLYARYWDDKQGEIRAMLDRDPRWTEVLDAVVDRMSEEQALEAPRAVVDSWKADVDALLSSSVLMEEDGRLAFFHETFFDYAFARRFNGRGKTLDELLSRDQLLFRRAQVRQILAHERESSPPSYERDLRLLLCDDRIRFHLKELVLAWLQTVTDPRQIEWDLLRDLMGGDSDALSNRAWLALRSPAWFRFLNERGAISIWLAKGGEAKERALALLTAAAPEDGDAVAELLGPYQDAEGSDQGLESVLVRSDLASSRDLFDLLLKVVAENADLGRRDFWFLAHDLPEHQPEWACELLGAFLESRLSSDELVVQRSKYGGYELAPHGLHLQEYVVPAARLAPLSFVELVWPNMLRIIEQTAEPVNEDRLRQDAVWNLRHFGDGRGELEDELLLGAEQAMARAAELAPDKFEAILDSHMDTEYETVASTLLVGLASNPSRFADAAIDFLLVDRRRFRIAYSDGDHWGTRRLLEATSPYCSPAALARLEKALLQYYTPWEKSAASRGRQFGLAQFELIGGIAEAHRTPAMRKRFAELQRKFGVDDAWGPYGMRGGVVGSPIAESNARKMNDANWQRAMVKYASEERAVDGDFLKGGAQQLSSVLEALCKEEPGRFARLASTLSDEINPVYFEAILRGVEGGATPLPLGDAEALIARCHQLPGKPCGRWLAHPLRDHLNEKISDETLEILSWYATKGDGASTVNFGDESEDDDHAERNILTRGLNSVRGGMAYDLARLVQADAARITTLERTLRSLCNDESTAVRALAAEVVRAVFVHDTRLGLDLFLELVDVGGDELLATRHVRQIMVWLGSQEFQRLKPLIRRMIESPIERVRAEGAAQAALAALTESAAQSLAKECEEGTSELRLGVARVFAQNLDSARFQARCEEGLVVAFDDSDPEVRKAATEAVKRLTPDQVDARAGLVERFMDSQAFEEDTEAVLFPLDDAVKVPVGLALDACERTLDMLASPDAEVRRAGAVAREVSEILTRAYVDAQGNREKERALDVIDRSLEVGAYGADRALSEHDR